MNKDDIFDVYTDYLITSFSYTTATGLPTILDDAVSHDQETRFLSQQDLTSKERWKVIKKTAREIESEEGVLIFDHTLEEKSYSKEHDLICSHYDHTVGRAVKRINGLNCLYYANEVSLPVAFELVKKPIKCCDIKTKKEKRKSTITTNQHESETLY
ncbi:MAG: transposase [Cocleimonas sp.]|nr:transposase [Cocleimonas sp.]